jgi:DNA polymerase I
MSGDPELTRAFNSNEDIHRKTAAEIFATSTEEITDEQRSIAKAINFGLMYGKTAFGLAQELKIPRREASDMIHRYFERYSSVKRLLDSQIQQAKDKGYVTTLMNRIRRLPDIRSRNAAIRAIAERMAMNTPLQGTAADLMKLAMIEIDRQLVKGGFQSKLIIQVHDEVIFDCPKDEVKEVEKLVVEAMEGVFRLSVPLKVNTATGQSWMEL